MTRNVLGTLSLMVLGLTTVAGAAFCASPQSQQEEKARGDQQGQMMQCPMMETLKSVQLNADAPPVLLAQEKVLDLTAEQKEQLQEIAAKARRQAREVLNDEQREKIEKAPSGSLAPMQLARMLAKDRQMRGGEGEEGPMCPMCMRMMQQRMQDQQEEREHEQQGQRGDTTGRP